MTNDNDNDNRIELIGLNEFIQDDEDCAAVIDELRIELERVKGIARDRLATIAALRSEVDTAIGIIDDRSCQESLDECEASLSPDGHDGLYGAYLRGELD